MNRKIIQPLLLAALLAVSFVPTTGFAAPNETLKSEMAGKNISVITVGKHKFHTFYGISNSHIIETPNELRLIDAQMIFTHARALKSYIEKLGKPLVQVILSHNHPDHWFGAEVFAGMAPVAVIKSVGQDLKTGGMRYVKGLKKKLKDNMPDKVIVPNAELDLGKQSWNGLDVIVEEYADHESHHSTLIKIPEYGIMIGQDLFYNGVFLVASERKRNANWIALLHGFANTEAKSYKTLLVGHGKNGGPEILNQDIEYLTALEDTLKKNLSKEETQKTMLKLFPGKGGKGMLGISMRNLFSRH